MTQSMNEISTYKNEKFGCKGVRILNVHFFVSWGSFKKIEYNDNTKTSNYDH